MADQETMVYRPGKMIKIGGEMFDHQITTDIASAKKDGWKTYDQITSKPKPKSGKSSK